MQNDHANSIENFIRAKFGTFQFFWSHEKMKYLILLSMFIIILINGINAKDTKKNGRTGKCNDFNDYIDF